MAADLHYKPERLLGQTAICGGFLVLFLAILPFPFPRTITAFSVIALVVSVIALKRGAASGGTTSAFGLTGTALASVAVLTGGTSVITAPEPHTPPPDIPAGEGEPVTPEPTAEPTRETTVAPAVVRLQIASVTASSTADGGQDASGGSVSFAAENVADADPATAWRTPGRGIGETLTFTFSQPVHLVSVSVIPGYAKSDPASGEDRFTQNRRVEQARFDFGAGVVNDFSFTDSREFQDYPVSIITDTVEVTVLSSTAQAERDFTAISEIEFSGWVN